MNEFTHLNVHTEYSIIDGIIKITDLLNLYKKYNIKNICITDIMNLASLPEYYYYCLNEKIKPIIGVECYLLINGEILNLILLAKNNNGYLNLVKLLSNAWRYGNISNGVFLKIDWVYKNYYDLIVLINLRYYIINTKNNLLYCSNILKKLILIFKEFIYLELNRINIPYEEYINEIIFYYSKKFNIKIVGTNSVKFLFKKEFLASISKALLCQNKTFNDNLFFDYSENQYIKNKKEMIELFKDRIDVILNINFIVNNCNILFKNSNFDLPNIKVKNKKLRFKIFENLLKIGIKSRILKKKKISLNYLNRINKEILVTKQLALIDYFLIISEFIIWSKKNDIFFGPGRGSGASSLICYCLYITDIDPLNENLLFERFISSERTGIPDLDLDFCVLDREVIISHIFNYYNYKKVSQIISYHSVSTKSSIRDLSRAIGVDYVSGDRFAKCMTNNLDFAMENSFRSFIRIRNFISRNKKGYDIFHISSQLEGVSKNISKHAGGIVISKKDLCLSSAILFDDEECLTHFEKIVLQDLGLIKFDFLGLKTLSIIKILFQMIPEKTTGEFLIDDFKTYQMLNNFDTDLIFQLESFGIRKLIKKINVENIFDIINLLSLYRPGPIQSGFINDFINRKNNVKKTFYPYSYCNFFHSKIILSNTHGVILFQEQVIQLIKFYASLNNYDSEKAYNVMINKNQKDLIILKNRFIYNCLNLKINANHSILFFDIIEKFASYSFNKTHAHSYAKIVFQTAYLKANYTLEYYLSCIYVDQLLNIDIDYLLKIIKRNNVIFYKPDINISSNNFKIYKKGYIYGFDLLLFIDQDFINKILYYRNKIFFFTCFESFCKIFSILKVKKKKMVEELIFCGFFDCYKINRIILFINFQFIYEKIIFLNEEYNRIIIPKYIKYINYAKLEFIFEKIIDLTFNTILSIEKKKLKFYTSYDPINFILLKFLGHENLTTFYKLNVEKYNLVLAFVKYKNFKKNNNIILGYKEKTFFCSRFSKKIRIFRKYKNGFFFLKKDKNKKYLILKCYDQKRLFFSLGKIYILILNLNFFNLYNSLNTLINKHRNNYDPIFFCLNFKGKKIFFNLKICLFFNNKLFSYLKNIFIKNFYRIICFK